MIIHCKAALTLLSFFDIEKDNWVLVLVKCVYCCLHGDCLAIAFVDGVSAGALCQFESGGSHLGDRRKLVLFSRGTSAWYMLNESQRNV